MKKTVFRVSDTNRAVQPQKMARAMKFRIYVVEGSYYPYSENKGADQLCNYCAADLCLCFRICKKPVFSQRGSYQEDPSYKADLCLCFRICKKPVFSQRGSYQEDPSY